MMWTSSSIATDDTFERRLAAPDLSINRRDLCDYDGGYADRLERPVGDLDVVGGDVVEVAPQYDATTNTAQVGAQMLFEILSMMACRAG